MAEETKKPMRRGISNETRGTSRLLFDTRDAKSNGAEFKCVFKTTNVGNASTSFLRCLTGNTNDPVGLNMKVHEANLITSADSLTFSYSEDDIIEFEYNINAIDT